MEESNKFFEYHEKFIFSCLKDGIDIKNKKLFFKFFKRKYKDDYLEVAKENGFLPFVQNMTQEWKLNKYNHFHNVIMKNKDETEMLLDYLKGID